MKWKSRWIVSWIRCEGFCNAVHCDDTFDQIKFWIYKVPESKWNHVATYYSVLCMLSFLLKCVGIKKLWVNRIPEGRWNHVAIYYSVNFFYHI
jgi:hypothetical protein